MKYCHRKCCIHEICMIILLKKGKESNNKNTFVKYAQSIIAGMLFRNKNKLKAPVRMSQWRHICNALQYLTHKIYHTPAVSYYTSCIVH